MRLIGIIGLILVLPLMIVFAQQKAELIVQKGHSTAVTTLAFSGDGRILVSGEQNGTVKMWDLQTGANVRSIELNSDLGDEIALNAAGRNLFTASVSECAFWDLQDGGKVQSFKCGDGENYFSIRRFNFPAMLLAVSNQDSFDLADLKNKKTIKLAGIEGLTIHALDIAPDGKTIAVANYSAADDDGEKPENAGKKPSQLKNRGFSVRIYDVASGQLTKKIQGLSGAANSLSFSSDGRFLAGSGEAFDDAKPFFHLWNAASGEQTANYKLAADDLQITLIPNGAIITTAANDLKVFRFDRGTLVPQTLSEKSAVISAAAFAPDGETLVTGDISGTLKFWNLKDGSQTRQLGSDISAVSKIQIDDDNRRLFFAQKKYTFTQKQGSEYESEMKIFDFESGVKNKVFPAVSNGIAVADFAFGKDGKTFAVSGKSTSESRVKSSLINLGAVVGNSDSNQKVVLKAAEGEVFTSLVFSPDGKTIATGSTQQGEDAEGRIGGGSETRAIKIWDAATGKLKLRMLGKYEGGIGAENTCVAFSPDGKTLSSVGSDEIVRFWDAASGRQINIIDRHSDDIAEIYNFSPDGKTLAFSSFGSDGERRKIKLLNIADGTIAHTFAGHTGEASSVAFTADGKILISSSDDGTVKFWNVEDEKEIASLIFIGADDWIITTPEGLFDGTPAAWKSLLWRFDNDPFNTAPIEVFFNEFYYPGLAQEIIAGRQPPAPKRNLSDIDIRQPDIKIAAFDDKNLSAKTTPTADKSKIKVKIEITDNGKKPTRQTFPPSSGAIDLRIFRNGSLVKIWRGDVFALDETSGCRQIAATSASPKKAVCETDVQIAAGENKFSAYAFNHDNVKSNDANAAVKGADSLRKNGTLYILAFGVNRYEDVSHNLKFAVADVNAVSQEIAAAQNKLLQKQYSATKIIKLNDEQATRQNMTQALEMFSANGEFPPDTSVEVKNELSKIVPATPDDALVIYYAGHGTASKDRFYLIPHDGFPVSGAGEKYYEELYARSISDEKLESLLETVDAGKILMVIDACNSGQALEAEEKRRGPMNSKGLAQLAYEKGIYILTAAQSFQSALEVSQTADGKSIEHGLLTYSLLEGLKAARADANSDKQIIEREWLNFAVAQVPQLQIETMQRRDAKMKESSAQRSSAVSISGGKSNLAPPKRGLQTPRVFYRREDTTKPLVIAAP